jgi:hypothetical protein
MTTADTNKTSTNPPGFSPIPAENIYGDPDLPVGDIGAYPDTSPGNPTVSRSTADFINDMWASRQSPVYVLRPPELKIIGSHTLKGWFWRIVVQVCRYKKTSASRLDTLQASLGLIGTPEPPATDPVSTERSMRHYLTITKKFTPERKSVAQNSCDSSEWHQDAEIKPKKLKKKAQKPTRRKLRKE